MQSGLPFNLDDLLHQRAIESNRVEFKATWDGAIEDAVVRTACAFANDLLNLNGGYIVLGVEEQEGRPILPPGGLGASDLELLQKKIYGACKQIKPDYQPIIFVEHPHGRPLLVLQCPGGQNRPYQAPDKKGGSAYFVRQGPQSVAARDDTLRQLWELAAKVPFDDRRSLSGSLRDLSPTLVRRFLRDVGSRLADESIEDPELYRRMQLVLPINSHEVPRNIGLLFFNEDPDKFFRGAYIEVVRFVEDGDRLDERQFRGPLSEQVRACLDYLTGMTGTMVHKRADRPESDRIPAYPIEAIREALINAVYHRGYDGPPEPVKVYLRPDRIEINSYPGPLAGIELKHFQPRVAFPPVPARNRRIGDFLKELGLAEGRGTGILKITKTMRNNGSPPPEFSFNPERTYFQTTLFVHRHYVLEMPTPSLELLREAFQRQPGYLDLTTKLVLQEIASGHLEEARLVLRTFSERMEEGEDQPGPYFAAARSLLEHGKRDEALAALREMPNVRMWIYAHLEHAWLTRQAGDLYGSYPLFELVYNLANQRADVLSQFAVTKLQLADDFTNGAREQLLWEATELLREAGARWRAGDPDYEDEVRPAAVSWCVLAHILDKLGMPLEEIDNAFQQALALQPKESAIQGEYAAWKQRTALARRRRRRAKSEV